MHQQNAKPVLELYHPVAMMCEYEELLEDIEEIDSVQDNKDIARFIKDKLIRFDVQQNPETGIKLINFYGTLIDNIADDVDFLYLRDLNMLLMDLLYQVIVNMDDLEFAAVIIDGLSESHVNIIASKIETAMEQGIEEIKAGDYYQFKHHFNDAPINAKKDLLSRILRALIFHRKNQERIL